MLERWSGLDFASFCFLLLWDLPDSWLWSDWCILNSADVTTDWLEFRPSNLCCCRLTILSFRLCARCCTIEPIFSSSCCSLSRISRSWAFTFSNSEAALLLGRALSAVFPSLSANSDRSREPAKHVSKAPFFLSSLSLLELTPPEVPCLESASCKLVVIVNKLIAVERMLFENEKISSLCGESLGLVGVRCLCLSGVRFPNERASTSLLLFHCAVAMNQPLASVSLK